MLTNLANLYAEAFMTEKVKAVADVIARTRAQSPLSSRNKTLHLLTSDFEYDLFVIGAGSGGVRAARVGSGHGARVAIAEEYRIG